METKELVRAQREFFETDETKPYAFRIDALRRLQCSVEKREADIFAALREDLGKSDFEAYMTEVGLVKDELKYAIKHLKQWMRPQRKRTPMMHFPAKSRIWAEPYGVALIMSPWNYPFQMTILPLVGALAAGNCAVVKPSNYSPHTSNVMAEMVRECFEERHVATVLGGRQQNGDLLNETFDYIFFTGGITVGKLVMKSASKNLTPVTLELGGKSPCIVDETANVKLAAKRIAFGKFINAGQTCIAPDYVYAHDSVKDALVAHMKESVAEFYGDNALQNPDYPNIVSDKHYNRLMGLMDGAHILIGGGGDAPARKIQPTLLDSVDWDSPVMGEEIFGPLLPVMSFDSLNDVIREIKAHHRPLSLYLFTENKAAKEKVIDSVAYGGGCINDTIVQVATTQLPFGGVGYSGMGSYHGKKSFDTFTHYKSVLEKSNTLDIKIRYLPASEKKLKTIRKFMG